MKQRIITGLILAALALSVIYIGQTALTVGLLLVSLLGVYEIVKICHRPDWSYIVDVYCLAMSVWLFLGTQDFFIPAWQEMLFLIGLFTLVVLLEQFKIDSYLIFTMMIFVLTALRGIAHIRASLGLGAIFFLLFATYGCDTGAYFTGYLIGKHPLIPRLSPKKTVEGIAWRDDLRNAVWCRHCLFLPFWANVRQSDDPGFSLDSYQSNRRSDFQCPETSLPDQGFFKFVTGTWRCFRPH